jgi:transposase InsO family protein
MERGAVGSAPRAEGGAPGNPSRTFRAELRWLGIQRSPSFVGGPQSNEVIERFLRTLKEPVPVAARFADLVHVECEIEF